MNIDAPAGRQPESFYAAFELKGRPEAGELTLYNPLGGTLGRMVWTPAEATLHDGSRVQQFPSLAALTERVTGAAIPVGALFDWLDGTPTPVPGWQPDLGGQPDGRITAVRNAPAPRVDLRVVLER